MPEPPQFEVTFSPLALSDIAAAHLFVARVSPEAADRLVIEIRNATKGLRSMPDRGHQHPSIADRQVRVLVVRRRWLILFRRSGTRVQIVRVVRGNRDLTDLELP